MHHPTSPSLPITLPCRCLTPPITQPHYHPSLITLTARLHHPSHTPTSSSIFLPSFVVLLLAQSPSPFPHSHHPSPSHTIILPSSPSQHASVTLHIHQLRLQSSSPASLSSSLPNHPPPSPIFPLSCRRCGVQDNWLYWECLCESVWGISC